MNIWQEYVYEQLTHPVAAFFAVYLFAYGTVTHPIIGLGLN